MKKEEYIHIHMLLAQYKKYCEENSLISELRRYDELRISPFEVHRSKEEHKRAIFVLSTELVTSLTASTMPAVRERNPLPRKLRSGIC